MKPAKKASKKVVEDDDDDDEDEEPVKPTKAKGAASKSERLAGLLSNI